jgi:hypothetical protein
MMPINFSEVFIERTANEVAPEEHSEPGTGVIDPTINEDDSADTGSRRDTPPAGEDGTVPDRSKTVTNPNPTDEHKGGDDLPELTPEQLEELRTIIGIDEHGDVVASVRQMSEELTPLRELKNQLDAKKKFAEEYPDEAKRLELLEQRDQENFAKKFSEDLSKRRVTRKVGEGDDAKDENTTLGLSALALDEIEKCAKEFSEGKPSFDTFKGALDSIFENGIVDYGNKGSELTPPVDDDPAVVPGSQDARTKFAEKVTEIQKKDELSFEDAFAEAAKRHPKLAEAWRQPPVAA